MLFAKSQEKIPLDDILFKNSHHKAPSLDFFDKMY